MLKCKQKALWESWADGRPTEVLSLISRRPLSVALPSRQLTSVPVSMIPPSVPGQSQDSARQ